MKAKTNLELFKNEIVYTWRNNDNILFEIMNDIYKRETGEVSHCLSDMLDWFSDVPRETLELSKEIYDFLKAYNDEVICKHYTIDNYTATRILIDIGIIPKKYTKYKISDLIKIIKVKKESNK